MGMGWTVGKSSNMSWSSIKTTPHQSANSKLIPSSARIFFVGDLPGTIIHYLGILLAPCGPLRMLVETSEKRIEQPFPSLIYSSEELLAPDSVRDDPGVQLDSWWGKPHRMGTGTPRLRASSLSLGLTLAFFEICHAYSWPKNDGGPHTVIELILIFVPLRRRST